MAIFDDTFQGYGIGSTVPLGSWVKDPGNGTIVAGGDVIPGTDRHMSASNTIAYVNPSYLTSFSSYYQLFIPSVNSSFFAIGLANGPNLSGQTFQLLQLRVEIDSTISIYDAVNNVLLGNSKDAWFRFGTWNFIQINIILSDVMVGGINHVNVNCQVGLNETQVISFNTTTAIPVTNLFGGTSQVNRFQLIAGDFGGYTLDVHNPIGTDPHPGVPNAIAYQSVIEVDELPNSANIDVYQGVIEVDELPNSANIDVYQAVIEVDLKPAQAWHLYES